jgi:hypothetical protein
MPPKLEHALYDVVFRDGNSPDLRLYRTTEAMHGDTLRLAILYMLGGCWKDVGSMMLVEKPNLSSRHFVHYRYRWVCHQW